MASTHTRAVGALLLAVFALVAISVTATRAQVVANPFFPYVCERPGVVLADPSQFAPPLVRETLKRFPSLAFRVCGDRLGNDHYFLRAPEQTTIGVCVIYEAEVFSPVDPNAAMGNALLTGDPNTAIHWWAPPKPWNRNPFGGQKATTTRRCRASCQAGQNA